MTTVARLRIEKQTDGKPYLAGSLLMPLDKGALIHLRKLDGDTYALVAVTGCGKDGGDRSRQSLLSFVEIPTNGAADV